MSDMVTACQKLATVARDVTGILRVHSIAADGPDGLPDAINETPAIIAYPLRMYAPPGQMNHFERHEYLVRMLVLAARTETPSAANRIAPMVDRLLFALAGHVTLGGQVTQTRLEAWAFGNFEYADTSYIGFQVDVLVRETTQQEYAP